MSPPRWGSPTACATARATATRWPRRPPPTRPRCTACCAHWPASGCSTRTATARFALTAIGECLRSDAAEPVGGWAAFVGRPYHWQAWGALLHGVRTGESAFRSVHGTDVWEYRRRAPRGGRDLRRRDDGHHAARQRAPARRLRLRALRDRGRRRRRPGRLPHRDPRGPSRDARRPLRPAPRGRGRGRRRALRGRRRQLLRRGAARAPTPTCSRRSCTTGRTTTRCAILAPLPCRDPRPRRAARRRARPRRAQRERRRQALGPQHAGRRRAGASARATSSRALFAAGGFALHSATPSAIGLSVFEGHPV